jgi:hypothetical protein
MDISCWKGHSLCEEFSDYVLYDERNDSILTNVHEQYLIIVIDELRKMGYVLVFRTKLKLTNSYTCTFIKG